MLMKDYLKRELHRIILSCPGHYGNISFSSLLDRLVELYCGLLRDLGGPAPTLSATSLLITSLDSPPTTMDCA